MESKLRNDLILYDKLKDQAFKKDIEKAYNISISLKIYTRMEYYIYQIYIDELQKVTFEDIISYGRLLDNDYFNSLTKIKYEKRNNCKIISFPKFPN